LDDDLDVRGGEILEGFGRGGEFGLVMDEGEPAPVEGDEVRVVEGDRKGVGPRLAMGGEKARGSGGGGQVGVKAEDDVGIRRRTFHLDAGQERGTVPSGHDAFSTAGPGPHSAEKLS